MNKLEQTIIDAARRYNIQPEYLVRIANIESGGVPTAKSKLSSASGLFQFTKDTAKDYGLQNPFDPAQSADAAARFTRDNINYLKSKLGRDPTPAETYLAHQQGRQGAVNLLLHPDRRADQVINPAAITNNKGLLDMTAGEFANSVMNYYSGGGQSARQPSSATGTKMTEVSTPSTPARPQSQNILEAALNNKLLNSVSSGIKMAAMEIPQYAPLESLPISRGNPEALRQLAELLKRKRVV